MLGNFMEDIGITPAQFEAACNRNQSYAINFNHVINIIVKHKSLWYNQHDLKKNH